MTASHSLIHEWFDAANGRYNLSLCHSACRTLHVSDLLNDADLHDFSVLSLAYGAFDGLIQLRTAIASHYKTIDDSQVITFNGPSEAIYTVMRAALRPGDQVVVPTLFISHYERSLNRSVVRSVSGGQQIGHRAHFLLMTWPQSATRRLK